MAGRVFAFADAEIIRLSKSPFVPVCADDWYQRRRTDAEGRFFKKVVSQGPRSPDAGTHQGIYVLTADGELLTFKNAGQDVKATREQLAAGLRKWQELPAARRTPGAVVVEDHGPLDATYGRTPPAGGLIVRVHARILDQTGDRFTKASCDFPGGDRASRDFLWLTADDVKQLAPAENRLGYSYPVPARVAERVLRFHLVDNTRGEPDAWAKEHIRTQSLTLTVMAVGPEGVQLRLDGRVLLEAADRGYEAKVFGDLRYTAGTFERFEAVAVGEHWGAGTFTKKGERPGRGLLGVAFGLADPAGPADRVAPQGSRELAAYFGRGS